MSLDTPTISSVTGVTTNITDDAAVASVVMTTTDIDKTIPSLSESIRDFLAKPYLIYSNVWTTSDPAGALLFGTLGLGTDAFLETITPWFEKIKGFGLVRGRIVFRLQINSNPFQQGKLLLHFLPMRNANIALGGALSGAYGAMHNYDLATRTQQPHVELDCRDSSAVMEIPYVTPADYYMMGPSILGLPKYDRGSVFLSVLAPLRVGSSGSNFIDYSFYVSYEDVEMAAPIVPQMGGKKRFKAVNLKEMEGVKMANTPISSALATGSKVAAALGAVPMLTPLCEPAAWVMSIASGVAGAFGWAKPANELTAGPVARQFNKCAATGDGFDNSFPLALRVGNAVTTITDKSLTDEDEMSFAFLKRVESMTQSVVWTTSQDTSTSIYKLGVSPRSIAAFSTYTKSATNYTLGTGPPVWYLSQQFVYYRGSIKVRIKIAKTDFHSGRIQITYTPRPAVSTPITLFNSFFSLREILDIRSGDEIEMVLPYLYDVPYIDMDTPIGELDIKVLNVLKAPETVSPAVDLLFYFSGGPDLEFAVPGYNPTATNRPPFVPQIGPLLTGGIANQPVPSLEPVRAEHCIGEMFSSIRQLLARQNQIFMSAGPSGVATQVGIWPFFCSAAWANAGGVYTAPARGGDLFSFFAPMYVFQRGGMRVMSTTANTSGAIAATLRPSFVSITGGVGRENFANSAIRNGEPTIAPYLASTVTIPNGTTLTDAGIGSTSFSLPYYCKTPVSLIIPNVTDNIPWVPLPTPFIEFSQPTSAVSMTFNTTASYYRAIAEDFQFTYFVGCPPLNFTGGSSLLAGLAPVSPSLPDTDLPDHEYMVSEGVMTESGY